MINLRFFSGLLSLLFLTGCSINNPPYTSMSLVRMESPELTAQPLKFEIYGGLSDERQFTLSNKAEAEVSYGCSIWSMSDAETAQIDQCKRKQDVYRGTVSVASGWALSYTQHAQHRISLKQQFAGQSSEAAATGNWSQAWVLGYSWQQEDFDGPVRFRVDEGGSNLRVTDSNWQQKTTGFDVGYVIGYRVNPSVLVYGGPYLYKGRLKGEQILTLANSTERFLDLTSSGQQVGANLALQFQFAQHFLLQTELVASQLRWEDARKHATQLNLMLGVQF